jgi:hypothetical protein
MEVVIEGKSDSKNSSMSSNDDPDRKELLWESREEDLIHKWKKHCIIESRLHGEKARRVKKQYTALSIPAIILPLVLSGFSSLIQPYPLVNSITLMAVAILTGISGFFNLGGRCQKHFQYEGLYNDLALNIDSEMCKPKKARIACDLYLERVKNNVSKLDLSCPPL